MTIVTYFKFKLFIKTQDWQKIPALTAVILFLCGLIHHGQDSIFLLTFCLFIPLLLFLPYIQYSVQRDRYIGFIDQWIAMKKTRITYVLYKTVAGACTLILPLLILCLFFLHPLPASFIAGYLLCLLEGSILILILGVALSLFSISIIQLILFITPICIPYFLLTASAIKVQNFPVFMLISMLFITIGGVILLVDHVE
ncbi:MAG: hypothetical protein HEEMFOPI_01873 [Holosporales bacterium]